MKDTSKFELTLRGVLMTAYGTGLKREQVDYDSLISKVLSMLEPVELEALGEEELARIDIPLNISRQWMSARRYAENVMQHTVQHNQSKGQIFRFKE